MIPLKYWQICGIILCCLITILLLFMTSAINSYLTPRITVLCHNYQTSESNTTLFNPNFDISREECEAQRRATLLFIVFCLVRLLSKKFEAFIGSKIMKTCGVRTIFPGLHFGAALGFPYLTRSLSASIRVASAPVFLLIIFVSTSIAFYPYVKDFAKLSKLVYSAVQRRHYVFNHSLVIALIALYFYFATIFIELLDVSFGVYCPQTIVGIPILFPNFNFPLFLFLLHTVILHKHKIMPAIIYEVHNEDCFIQLNRMRCITNKDCPEMSSAFALNAIPSRTTTIQRRKFEGRIIQIRQLRELDDILPCKISSQIRKVSFAMASEIQTQIQIPITRRPTMPSSSTVLDIG